MCFNNLFNDQVIGIFQKALVHWNYAQINFTMYMLHVILLAFDFNSPISLDAIDNGFLSEVECSNDLPPY